MAKIANRHLDSMKRRLKLASEADLYLYMQPIEDSQIDGKIVVGGREMLMLASYSYLGLLNHPLINTAAKKAIDRYGTGTHGVRLLAGTLPLHTELEARIADFKECEDAIVFSSGYTANLATISSLVGHHDVVLADKLNHASIIDGCLLSGAEFIRFKHNDMQHLEKLLINLRENNGQSKKVILIVADAVFSMDGDIINLPRLAELCDKYQAMLMIDEAHSLGVLGKKGRGIEEHFGIDVVDVKMGTLSKTIPAAGGYIAGSADMIAYLKHQARAFVFSAALPPTLCATAIEAFNIIEKEQDRVLKLRKNITHFINGLRAAGFNTLKSETAIVPIICGSEERAFKMAKLCQTQNVFVMPIVTPAVPPHLSRLRATVLASHSAEDIDKALKVFENAGKATGVLQ